MDYFTAIKQMDSKEIDKLIKVRLYELKKSNTEKKRIGLFTNTSIYSGFLDKNVSVAAIGDYNSKGEITRGMVVFDDDKIYQFLAKEIKEKDNVYEAVYSAALKYLTIEPFVRDLIKADETRNKVYRKFSMCKNRDVSIKKIKKSKSAMCLEIAGICQNMFKFLGIESDFVSLGYLDGEAHAYNVVYPEGRGRYKMSILFDAAYPHNESFPSMYELPSIRRGWLFSNEYMPYTNEHLTKTIREYCGKECIVDQFSDTYVAPSDGYYFNPQLRDSGKTL
jgi:hypothetical protein